MSDFEFDSASFSLLYPDAATMAAHHAGADAPRIDDFTLEELGLRISKDRFQKLAVYGEPGRIAAYRDGSIWRMVIVVFGLELEEEPQMVISQESKDLRFFSKEELKDIEVVITHSDIVEDWFINK